MLVLSLFIQMNDTRLVYACILSLHMHLSVMHHSPRLVVGADYIGPDPSSMSIGSCISQTAFFVHAGKMGLVNYLFHFLQVCQNIGTLFVSNLMLEVIENCIPQCMPTV